MYHVGMISIVVKILRCVCFFCSELLVNMKEDDARLVGVTGRERLNVVLNLCKSRRVCGGCGGTQPKYVYTRVTTSIALDTKDMVFETEEEEVYVKQPFTAARARAILEDISDKNVRFLGSCPTYARPEWMILTVLQIPPPISRPCITVSDGSRTKGQDDVTIKLMDIFRANKTAAEVLRARGAPCGFMPEPHDVVTSWKHASWDDVAVNDDTVMNALETLQQHLVQYLHHGNAVGMDTTKTGGGWNGNGAGRSRALRLIPARWKGKKGRFRGNLAGKRVNYSSRTVASPAPDFDVDEVGVPCMIATHLTFPERVTPYNVHLLTACVVRGPGVKHGASTVIIPGADPLDLSLCDDATREALQLEVGWIVERHLWDGDWVLVNRQPSLHRMSIMAHRVRIIPDRTFRLPVCNTTPYNADFDGDELNIHVLQTHDARAEAQTLMAAHTQMINPENNKPIIALVQDSLVSAYLMSSPDTFIRRDQAMQMILTCRYLPKGDTYLPPPVILKPTPLWSGKQLFSLLLPPHFMYVSSTTCTVVDGQLVNGRLCKRTMGTSAGGLVHVLIRDWGFETAANFVSDAQRMLRAYMMIRGFSVGVGDCVMDTRTHERVQSMLNTTFARTDALRAETGVAPPLIDACVTKMLGGLLTRGSAEVLKDESVERNNINVMIQCGAKGSAINIAQILSCVGQQSVEGCRIRLGTDKRTLPCFRHGDDSAPARGFVCNSYGTGLTAQEYFFHAMGGREGLVDTAVKTASTGYIQRRLSKAQEGLQVWYDATVRNSSGDVIQFYYGGDGYYPTKLERTYLHTFGMDNASLHDAVVGHILEWEAAGVDNAREWMADVAVHELPSIRAARDTIRGWQCDLEDAPEGRIVMPVNPERVLKRAVSKFGRNLPTQFTSPERVRAPVKRLLKRVRDARRHDATYITCAHIAEFLTTRNFVVVYALSEDAVAWVCDTVWFHFNESCAEPGEMVGTLGASSIGAPCTQMTLNTFHTAGVAAHTVTQGVPRLKELIDMNTKIRTPSIHVVMTPPYSTHERGAKALAAGIESTLLHELVETSQVVWNPVGDAVLPEEDAFMAKCWHALEDDVGDHVVIRIVLNRTIVVAKQLTVHHVGTAIASYLGDFGHVVWSQVNMMNWCVRVRLRGIQPPPSTPPHEQHDLEMKSTRTVHDFLLDNVPIHGVRGITRVVVKRDTVLKPDVTTGQLVKQHVWSADTEGTNLHAVLMCDGVDATRTHSNDIYETLEVLGVEAATHQLLTEIRKVLSHDGAYVNDRHLQLLVDVMTHTGDLAPVTRHSMLKLGASVYTRASFEQTQDVLTWAAAMGTDNPTRGVTENIMLGTPISGGTGSCDVITESHARPPKPYQTMHVKPISDIIVTKPSSVMPLLRPDTTTNGGGGGVKPLYLKKNSAGFVGKKRRRDPSSSSSSSSSSSLPRQLVFNSPSLKTLTRTFLPKSPMFQ